MSEPSDVSGLKTLFDEGTLKPENVIAILAKTEGNGCVNDFTRGYSTFAFQVFLAEALGISCEEVGRRIAFIMSGGTEGVLSPHATIFARRQESGESSGVKRLQGLTEGLRLKSYSHGAIAALLDVAHKLDISSLINMSSHHAHIWPKNQSEITLQHCCPVKLVIRCSIILSHRINSGHIKQIHSTLSEAEAAICLR